jgi:hypothetical protein
MVRGDVRNEVRGIVQADGSIAKFDFHDSLLLENEALDVRGFSWLPQDRRVKIYQYLKIEVDRYLDSKARSEKAPIEWIC